MFVRAPNPIWYLPDLVGQPLTDEYYAFFLTNTLPYLPQNVYRDPDGMTVWTGDVVQFSPNGTLPNNLYFDPTATYRIEIRHGNSQADQLIYEINNYLPGGSITPGNLSNIFSADNQISNPQFAFLNFVSPLTITTAGTHNIAPGWDLVLTGTGTTTLTQLVLNGADNIINDPPFALRIANNTWTTAQLVQRFNENGAIWANGAVSMSITARAETTPETVTLVYLPSMPSPGVGTIATALLGTGDYQVLSGAIQLGASINSTISTSAYVDMIIQLPTVGTVDITNVQVIGQSDPNFNPATDIPNYQQQTNEREADHLFHVYSNSLLRQSKNSFLTGWNFGLNPWQFHTTALTTLVPKFSYVADQTIVIQETASSIATAQASQQLGSGFSVKAVTGVTDNRFALIQYIDPTTMNAYWNSIVSSLARVGLFTSHGTQVRIKMRLIARTSLPSAISNTEPIASWPVASDPVFSAGWTAIAPKNDPAYYLTTLTTLNGDYPYYSFDQFDLPSFVPTLVAANTNTLGIVIYTMDNINETAGTEDVIIFDDISLTPNSYGLPTQAETADETLRKCQYYYEKSYAQTILAGAVTSNGVRHAGCPLSNSGLDLFKNSFILTYQQIKRTASTVTFYSSTGAINTVRMGVFNGTSYTAPTAGSNPTNVAISGWSVISSTEQGATFKPNTSVQVMSFAFSEAAFQGEIYYQYVADARLGI